MVTDQLMDARAYARSLVDLAALAPALSRPIHSYNQPLGVLDADILEERVMRLIEKKPRLSAKRAAALLIAASFALTISGVAASAFSLSLSQDKGAKPNFSGKWKSESTTNEAGDMPFPPGYKGEMVDIDHKDPELKVIKTIEAGAKIVVELSYTTDGKEKANTWGNVPARSKVNWNGKQMIITTWIETASGSVESKETWDLGDDQKTLNITREFMNSRAKTVCKRQ
jgi:hypothetical protein